MSFEKFSKLVDASIEARNSTELKSTSDSHNERVSNIFKYLINNTQINAIDFDSFSLEDCYLAELEHHKQISFVNDDGDFDEYVIFNEKHPFSYHYAYFYYDSAIKVSKKIPINRRKFV